ncbi:Rho guanine nucleotide exchange factor 4, partial [Coelomomyces lativittatus]
KTLYTLQSLLILPVQRIPRYKLLLQDLLHSQPPTLEIPCLKLALKELENLAQFVNESIRQHEKSMEMFEVRKKLIGFHGDFFLPSRSLLKSGSLTKVSRKSLDDR